MVLTGLALFLPANSFVALFVAVSIPYRQCLSAAKGIKKLAGKAKFQFLIGNVLAFDGEDFSVVGTTMFQFLIGNVLAKEKHLL